MASMNNRVSKQDAGGVAAQSASSAAAASDRITVINSRLVPGGAPHDRWTICAESIIGRRKKQEDRMIIVPSLGAPDRLLVGVFDGTVGDFASDFVHRVFADTLLQGKEYRALLDLTAKGGAGYNPETKKILAELMNSAFLRADQKLITACRERMINYSASTGVVVMVSAGVLTCGHVGDSRAALGRVDSSGKLVCTFLTRDHKPNQKEELDRIELAGGSLTYLHGGKPFIRGGDFSERQRRDIAQLPVDASTKCLVLASDGLWDTCSADLAVREAMAAFREGHSPAEHLVQMGLRRLDAQGSVDNITAVVVIFKNGAGSGVARTHTSTASGKN